MSTKRTFAGLLKDPTFRGVEIPRIQRDYAQGRPSVKEIRDQLLATLYTTLSQTGADHQALDLDFVYGNVDEKHKSFYPLDGQQRLTTLFLLHWYLAKRDNQIDAFRTLIAPTGHSRFTYSVRPSSKEFFDALIAKELDATSQTAAADKPNGRALSERIMDAPWFFLSWKLDPTIQSALGMLDAIEERFSKTEGFYAKLTQEGSPYITFQFLNLKEFGLSDDLYIKMNARGKPLTPFEAFKARLEQRIGTELRGRSKTLAGHEVTVREYFSRKIDTTWLDLFWHFRDDQMSTVDVQMMNFIRAVIFVHYPHGRDEAELAETIRVMNDLNNLSREWSYYAYESNKCLTAELLETLITLLDRLSGPNGQLRTYLPNAQYYDERRMFARVIAGKPRDIIYAEWVQFYAYCAFLAANEQPDAEQFNEWMRVIVNLSTNTIYNRVDETRNAIVSVRTLMEEAQRSELISLLATRKTELKGFLAQQYQEERLKAALMTKRPHWRARLLNAEHHAYFKGQIEFLLEFSGALAKWTLLKENCAWSDEEDEEIAQQFAKYTDRAFAIFGETGVKPLPGQTWERALLAKGDYLLRSGANWSFLRNPIGERETSWKRLLRGGDQAGTNTTERRAFIRNLLDRLDPANVLESLNTVIADYLARPTELNEEWRRKLIECPDAISYCRERNIRESDSGTYYLMSRSRMHGHHAELFTYHLYRQVLLPGMKSGKFKPFDVTHYEEMTTDSIEPYACLTWQNRNIELRIEHRADGYCLAFERPKGVLPQNIIDAAKQEMQFEVGMFDTVTKSVPRETVEKELIAAATSLQGVVWEGEARKDKET